MRVPADRDPQLVWTEADEPRSGRFDDVYFSAEDGLAETRAVFLRGCGLPDAWKDRPHFTIAELGFGTGLNIVAVLDLWQRTRTPGQRLSLFSVEGFPLVPEEARRALSHWPEVASSAEALLSGWPASTPGFHRIDLPGFAATLDLAIGPVDRALAQWSGLADAWFLDGFSPATNPDMWSEAVMDAIAARSAPDARIATFTVAGDVRRRLSDRGFVVEKMPGHGRKRQRLEARLRGTGLPHPAPASIAIVGAGIAGASVARALAAQGVSAAVYESSGPGHGASGFPAALVTPRFDLGDGTIAALFAQALERAGALYRDIPDAVLAHGVVQKPGNERDRARLARIVDQPIWDPGAMRLDDDGDLVMRDALTVAPAAILAHWLGPAEMKPGNVSSIVPDGSGWTLLDAAGQTLAEVETVVLCAGAGNADLIPGITLSPVRGQADWILHARPVAAAWGGYVAPTRDGFLFGATHDRDETTSEVRAADTIRNLATLAARFPDLAAGVDPATVTSRAAIRATTRDRLPVCGAVPVQPGLFVLGGLGSRGFCLAPLLAEHLVARALGRPSPLPADIANRIALTRTALQALVEPSVRQDD
ncbi:tRNA (5-methylaminomethyl-2-thiouridine)(34)-methyltransferase MnmD [Brevundimonas sp. AJA228-03]|uniref:tRNA (5-methylaminomethyl-2-thiouridine)(34)-methyltransferase MnmD n=1 Tax=Brevundimonas sp. AJA228-03 TaxID=2752515 RepID=UPI001ADF26B6|nr:tRNA (5-methylaminomethyl-2-thiouridine)(34)-methyltransferase MnmD [Brevundimonas sp. AJA228-03]QTN19529.1 tRNA (5-methylaminomethyl-2-thiouridine)(34)-methyltransferase MnmD [Brevundimonas sp. AJA228-03]